MKLIHSNKLKNTREYVQRQPLQQLEAFSCGSVNSYLPLYSIISKEYFSLRTPWCFVVQASIKFRLMFLVWKWKKAHKLEWIFFTDNINVGLIMRNCSSGVSEGFFSLLTTFLEYVNFFPVSRRIFIVTSYKLMWKLIISLAFTNKITGYKYPVSFFILINFHVERKQRS